MSFKAVKLFPDIYDIRPFINREHPILHPDSIDYSNYWEKEEIKCLEGFWGLDKADNKGGWRYMPPSLYFYINYCIIADEDERGKTTRMINPDLRDIDWLIHYGWLTALGFSGFENDEEYTCNRLVYKIENNIKLTPQEEVKLKNLNFLKRKDGEYKKYIESKEYLYKTFPKSLGRPIYDNDAKNFFLLTSRATGKSYSVSGILAQTFNFYGKKYYDESYLDNPAAAELLVGSSQTSKSNELIKKFLTIQEHLKTGPGAWGKGDEFIPGYFYNNCTGKTGPNNTDSPYRHEYRAQEGKIWLNKGTGTKLVHVAYADNAEAAVGTRPQIMVVEECGLSSDLLKIHAANETCMIRKNKFGSALYLGCVTKGSKVWTNSGEFKNIEDLKVEDGILSHDSETGLLKQDIEERNGRELTECYKIITNSGRVLNCSYDHPIYTKKRRPNGLLRKDFKFFEAQMLFPGDVIGVIDKVDVWSDKTMFDPYLLGMLISDGTYGNGQMPKIMNSDEEVWQYIHSKYKTKVQEKSKITKTNKLLRKERILEIIPELKNLGIMGQTKLDKRLPENIQSYSKEDVCKLIAGLFDGDGCIYFNEESKYSTIKYTSISRLLIYDLFYLLNKLGIHSKVRIEEPRKTKIANGKYQTYNLYIKDKLSLIRFYENISLLIKYKQEKLNKIYQNAKNNYKTKQNYDKVKNLRFETIVAVENIGDQEVYNLKAFGNHCYLANGIQTHNTGGNIDKINDSKIIFEDPETYDFVPYVDLWENRSRPIGCFIPAYYSNNVFKDHNGNTDIEAALEQEVLERKRKEQASNSMALDGYMMARPLVPSEMFLSSTSNLFPTAKLRQREAEIETKNLFNIYASIGDLEWNDVDKKSVKWVEDLGPRRKSRPIQHMNLDQYKANLNSAIVIYEHPPDNIPNPTYRRSLYKVVYDPVKDDGGGTSLASILVYKGFAEESWNAGMQDTIVAEMLCRYDKVDDIHELAIKLATYYNSMILVENNLPGFINYCKMNGFVHKLQICPYEAIKKGGINYAHKYEYGVTMTRPLSVHCEQLIRQMLLEPWKKLDDGVLLLGLDKLYSLRIIRELQSYDRDGNYDHVSSLKLLVLWLSQERDVEIKEDDKKEDPYNDLNNFFKTRVRTVHPQKNNWYA